MFPYMKILFLAIFVNSGSWKIRNWEIFLRLGKYNTVTYIWVECPNISFCFFLKYPSDHLFPALIHD